jgi:thioredoxin-dependent peroxiredoxin
MALAIGDTAPDFEADTTEGKIRFHDWIGNNWAVLFSHPKDFTPVCTTELGTMARLKPEFDKRGVKIIGLSVDPVDSHKKWSGDIKDVVGFAPNYPMIGDTDLKISKLYGMLPASTAGSSEGRTPADNQTVRNVFVIGPDKKIKLVLVYPMTTGRNFDEVIRVIDSLQLTAKHRVPTMRRKSSTRRAGRRRSPICASSRHRANKDATPPSAMRARLRPRSCFSEYPRRRRRQLAMALRHQQNFADIPAILNEVMRLRGFVEAEAVRDLRLDDALRPQVQ